MGTTAWRGCLERVSGPSRRPGGNKPRQGSRRAGPTGTSQLPRTKVQLLTTHGQPGLGAGGALHQPFAYQSTSRLCLAFPAGQAHSLRQPTGLFRGPSWTRVRGPASTCSPSFCCTCYSYCPWEPLPPLGVSELRIGAQGPLSGQPSGPTHQLQCRGLSWPGARAVSSTERGTGYSRSPTFQALLFLGEGAVGPGSSLSFPWGWVFKWKDKARQRLPVLFHSGSRHHPPGWGGVPPGLCMGTAPSSHHPSCLAHRWGSSQLRGGWERLSPVGKAPGADFHF